MARFVSDNPKSCKTVSLTPSGIAISSTGPSGTVNTSASSSSLERGQSVILQFTGGTAGGFTSNAEYFVIPGSTSGSFQIASTKEDAMVGNYISGASGNAGAGTTFPIYRVGGVLYVGTGGDLNIRGLDNKDTGLSSFSVMKNIPDSGVYPFMIKDICPSGTSATDLIAWCD